MGFFAAVAVPGVFFATTVVAPVVFAAWAAPWAAEATAVFAVLLLFLAARFAPAFFVVPPFAAPVSSGTASSTAAFFPTVFLAPVFLAGAFFAMAFLAAVFETAAFGATVFAAAASEVAVFEAASLEVAALEVAVFLVAALDALAAVLEAFFTGFAAAPPSAGVPCALFFPPTSLAAGPVDLPDADCCTAVFFATMAAAPSHIVILLANRAGTINRLLARGNGAHQRFARPAGPARQACKRCAQLPAG